MYYSTTLSSCFCCVEIPFAEVMDVAMIFHSLLERIMKRMDLLIKEITFLDYLSKIKETTVVGTIYGILYGYLPKVTVTLQGLDSYTRYVYAYMVVLK